MDIHSGGKKHLVPYEVHKENMQLLKIMPQSHHRSAPNSPMTKRSKDQAAGKTAFLSPSLQRKDFKDVTDEKRSKSLTHLTVGDGNSPKSVSPAESPIGSPLSVSERIIRTHFLSNTTGKPGSYLLKKSDEIVRNKSPSGSPGRSPSPNIEAKSPTANRRTIQSGNNVRLSAASAIPVVVSPATEESVIGFKGPVPNLDILPSKPTKYGRKTPDSDEMDLLEKEEQELEDIRSSIGLALKPKPPPPPPPPVVKKKGRRKTSEKSSEQSLKKPQKQDKPKLHHYPKYGNTNKSPGLLTPPLEPRGSKDLAAEMEIWERKQRRLFHDLDHVEEGSSLDPSEDEHSSGEEKEHPMAAQQAFAMPPVFENIPQQLVQRDFSVPLEIQGDIDEETWKQMKRCRYLRIDGEKENEAEDQEEDEEMFDSDEDDIETDEEDD